MSTGRLFLYRTNFSKILRCEKPLLEEMGLAILINGIFTELDEPIEAAKKKALIRLGLPSDTACFVAKTSVDARKHKIRFVHTVSVTLPDEETAYQRFSNLSGVTLRQEKPFEVVRGSAPMAHRPVIVGFGPAGMFCALLLARCGYAPIVLECGASMDERVRAVEEFWRTGRLNTETNVQFGEGGAGTFSDGKLTTRIGDSKCEWVLRELIKFGAPEELAYKAKPHIGTDLLRNVVKALREEILSLGGEVRFQTPLTDLQQENGYVRAMTPQGELPAGVLVLANGHSARDIFSLLERKNFALEAKPFSVGVRAEHLQRDIDRGLYGAAAGHPSLPQGEYQLSYREGERGVYTFCMCPGGVVVPAASEEGMAVTNGMSNHARDGVNANAAIAVSVTPQDYGSKALDGMRFQQMLEKRAFEAGGGDYHAPVQDVGHFLAGQRGFTEGRVAPSYCRGVQEGDFGALFPPFVTSMLQKGLSCFAKKLPGFAAPDAVLTGIETRTSSPVRILRQENYTALHFPEIYPCAEGAGYAGGIMSAAVDGLRVALAIMERFAPAKEWT